MVNWHNWDQIKSGVHLLSVLKLYCNYSPTKKFFMSEWETDLKVLLVGMFLWNQNSLSHI
jgi:hypothetical protein